MDWYKENMNDAKSILIQTLQDVLPDSALEDMLIARFGYDNINWDQLDYTFGLKASRADPVVALGPEHIKIDCNNLYTFTILCGRFVPYCEWVYEDKFEDVETGLTFSSSSSTLKKSYIVFNANTINRTLATENREKIKTAFNKLKEKESLLVKLKVGSVWLLQPELPF